MFIVEYADFDLEITRITTDRYRARVIDSPAGQASVGFARPFSEMELENFILKIGHTRIGVRRLESPEMRAAEAFGKKLFDCVFVDEVRECLTSGLHQVERGAIPGLRLKLRLVDVPELANLPWEFLYHPSLKRFIVLSTKTPITRYTDLPRPVTPLRVTTPLRLLVMVASPTDYPQLDVKREKAKLKSALRNLEAQGLIALEWLDKATLSTLQQRLRKGPAHIFHFIGHGGWDEHAEDGLLLFEDDYRHGYRVSANRLATVLHDHQWLRLVVLNACEGARTSPTDPFAGVAATLVQQGIPAVVAMQFEITDRAAVDLAQAFYESLADGYPAEAALAEARKAIFASGNDVEWGTPVLYLRAPDGRLFDMSVQSSRETEAMLIAHRKAEKERLAREKAEQDRLAKNRAKAEAERIAREKAEQQRLAQQKAEADRLAKQKAREEQIAQKKAERELRRQKRDKAIAALVEQMRRIPTRDYVIIGLVAVATLVGIIAGIGGVPAGSEDNVAATQTIAFVAALPTSTPSPSTTRISPTTPIKSATPTPSVTSTHTPTPSATVSPTSTPTAIPSPVPSPVGSATATVSSASTPIPSSSLPTITRVSKVGGDSRKMLVDISYSGFDTNTRYYIFGAFRDYCPDWFVCERYRGEIGGNYPLQGRVSFLPFLPNSEAGTVGLEIAIDNVFCQGGAFTTNQLTIELQGYERYNYRKPVTAATSRTFPITHTWCNP